MRISNINYAPYPRFTVKTALLLALGCSLTYPLLFSLVFGATISILVYSLVHAFLAALVNYRAVSLIILKKDRAPIGMATGFILINLLYFNCSSIKYFENELYPRFISNNLLRLAYSLLALLVLWFSLEVVSRLKTRYKPAKLNIRSKRFLTVAIVILLAFNIGNVVDLYQKGFGYHYHLNVDALKIAMERTTLSTISKFKMWASKNINTLLVLFLVLYFGQTRKKTLPVIAIFIIFLLSLFSGGRSSIFFFFMGLMVSVIYLYGIGRRFFALILLASPLIIAVASVLILSFSGRVQIDDLHRVKHQLAYRFDLSDFAGTLIEREGAFAFTPEIVSDAVFYSLPSAFFPQKYDINKKVALDQLHNAGLNELQDFTDTFFSIGAQLAGIVGFIFVPVIMIFFLFFLEQFLYYFFSKSSYFIIILMYPLYLRIETDLNSLFADWRTLPVYMVFGLTAYWLLNKTPRIFGKKITSRYVIQANRVDRC